MSALDGKHDIKMFHQLSGLWAHDMPIKLAAAILRRGLGSSAWISRNQWCWSCSASITGRKTGTCA